MKKFEEQLRLMAGKRVYIDTNIFIYFFNKWTDRKFNRMRPSMARVFGFETRRPRQTKAD
jgi:hypothetical protein